MFDSTPTGWLFVAVVLATASAEAQPPKKATPAAKKKGKTSAAPPSSSSTSTSAAPAQDDLAPLVPAAELKRAPEPAPTPVRVITANPDPPPRRAEPPPVVAAAPVVARPAALNRAWLTAWGGVAVPIAVPVGVLGVGPAAGVAFELRPWTDAPLRAALRVGFERHLGQGAGLFLSTPQPRGYDPAAAETQLLVPIDLGLVWEVVRPGNGALLLGASYSLIPTISQVAALGATGRESGLGHGVTFELGYGHRFGNVELSLRARWGVRTTSVGAVSSVLEQGWYQVAGGVLTVGYCL